MLKIPLEKPSPDFENLEKILKGEKQPKRVHFVEILINPEIMEYIVENYMNRIIDPEVMEYMLGMYTSREKIPPTEKTKENYQKQMIDFYYKMGYDFVTVWAEYENLPQFKTRKAADTASLSKKNREWAEEGGGIIKNWDDFEKIDWDNIKPNLEALDYAQKNLLDGMKIIPFTSLFGVVLEKIFGYEDLFILSHDNPKLVEAVFEQWGKKVYEYYKEAVQYPGVGAIFHADDLGFKTATLLSPEFLRKNVFPWFKKYAFLAHEQGKMYWYHCCGYKDSIMEDLIKDVKIDALHSFEDSCCPVTKYKRRYGNRIAILGGVDMDKLGRMSESELRSYVRGILDECMPGRYALGSGNSVANYIPVENYLAMLEEGLNWRV